MAPTKKETGMNVPAGPAENTGGVESADQTQADKAYKTLRTMILRCELRPGDVVQEKILIHELGIGRTPIREALLRLAGERLVMFRSNQIQVASIGIDDIRDLFELRMHNERMAARLFLRRLTPEREHALEHSFDLAPALLEQNNINAVINLDFEFHSLLYRGSRNAFLIHHLHNLFGHSYRLWWLTHETSDAEDMSHIVSSHEPIIDAVKRRDAAALDKEITAHIVNSFERAIAVLKGDGVDGIKDLAPYDWGGVNNE